MFDHMSYSSSEKNIRNTNIYKAIMLFFSFCYVFTISMSIYLVFSSERTSLLQFD